MTKLLGGSKELLACARTIVEVWCEPEKLADWIEERGPLGNLIFDNGHCSPAEAVEARVFTEGVEVVNGKAVPARHVVFSLIRRGNLGNNKKERQTMNA